MNCLKLACVKCINCWVFRSEPSVWDVKAQLFGRVGRVSMMKAHSFCKK